jgi:hypothetical protein
MGVRGQRHASAALYPLQKPGTHCTGGWVGPRTGLDKSEKFHPPPGFYPRALQPVESHYTYYATRPTERPLGFQKIEGSQISRQSVNETGKVVRRTRRPPLLPSQEIFLLEAESIPGL